MNFSVLKFIYLIMLYLKLLFTVSTFVSQHWVATEDLDIDAKGRWSYLSLRLVECHEDWHNYSDTAKRRWLDE